jgi:hypothetical protein
VLAQILFGPAALAVFTIVGAGKGERAHPVASFCLQAAVAEAQVQGHRMAAGNPRLDEETGPGTTRETGIRLQS